MSNEEFELAYNNIDNKLIIKKVLGKYRGKIDDDTLESCGLNALWRCLKCHDSKYQTKFTSSLWRFTVWECDKELENRRNNHHKPVELFDIAEEETSLSTIFDDLDAHLDQEHSTIIRMKFINNCTLKEIGTHFGYTKEAARQKLGHALDKLKMVYNRSEDMELNLGL